MRESTPASTQNPQVVAECGLGEVEFLGEVAEACFTVGGPTYKGEEFDADGVAEGFEQASGHSGFVTCDGRDRGGAVLFGVLR